MPGPRYPVSFQLYSARHFWPIEPQLEALAAMGYDAVEPWLPAYEADPEAFGEKVKAAGLACYGFHMPLKGLIDQTARYVEVAQALGAWLMIPPWLAPEERGATAADWRRLGEQLTEAAETVAPHGLEVAWHNHDFEFFPLADGSRPIDHIFAAAGPAVGLEIDCGWIRRAGVDPAGEVARFGERIRAIQLKDTAPLGTREDDGWTATGDGIIDWAGMADGFRRTRADHLVAEHDNPSDWQRFARRSLDAIRRLGL